MAVEGVGVGGGRMRALGEGGVEGGECYAGLQGGYLTIFNP